MSVHIAVFASGGGTNLQALLDHFEGGERGGEVALVVSDRPDAGALDRARRADVDTRVVPVSGRPTDDVSRDMLAALDGAGAEVIALAGYLRRVPDTVVDRYRGRIVNIHPALLPAFGGKGMYGIHVHRAVLEAGCRVTGVTIHCVDERYDQGAILIQWPVPVADDDDPEGLSARVRRVEHRLYPAVVEAIARTVERGGEVGPFTVPAPAGFRLSQSEAPAAEEVREVLGLR